METKNNISIVAIIPARSGSKRLPEKNIKLLNGKPLIAYTIEAARKSKYLDRIIVSTDSKEIASIAEKYGAEVPFIRPKYLATDRTPGISVVKHLANWLIKNEEYKPDVMVILQPTSPLRKTEDIDNAIELLLRTGVDSVVGVCEVIGRLYLMSKNKNGFEVSDVNAALLSKNKQSFEKFYVVNGAIYVTKTDVIIKENTDLPENRVRLYPMPRERSIDIDTMFDFKLAESIIKVR